MMQIFPSLLAADPANLENLVVKLDPLVPGFHVDVMDNVFVPNTGIGIEITNKLAKLTIKQLWVHLMVKEPEAFLDLLHIPAGSIVAFHIEARTNTPRLIQKITDKGWLPSMAINPTTSVEELFPYLDRLHQALIMSVKPGFSGQLFLAETVAKIAPLVGYRNTSGINFKIAMDGGIGIANIAELSAKGVDQVAVGSDIFNHKLGAVEAYRLLEEKIK